MWASIKAPPQSGRGRGAPGQPTGPQPAPHTWWPERQPPPCPASGAADWQGACQQTREQVACNFPDSSQQQPCMFPACAAPHEHLSQRHPINRRRSNLGERLCRLAVAAERQSERWGRFVCGRKSVRCRRWHASSGAWLCSCAAALPLHENPPAAPGCDALTSQLHFQDGVGLAGRTRDNNRAAAISPSDPARVSKGEHQLDLRPGNW